MPRDSEFSDYEPIIRGRRSQVSAQADIEDDWKAVRGSETKTLTAEDENEFHRKPIEANHEGGTGAKAESEAKPLKLEPWRPGHTATFIGLFLFTAVLFFRPYELFSALSGLTSLAFWIGIITIAIFIPSQLGLDGTITARPRELKLILLLTVLALLSIPFAISPSEAWFAFSDTFIRAVLIFIVAINVTRTERRVNALIFLSLAVAIVLSVAGIYDYATGNLALQGIRIKGLIGGIFGNPNDLAIHLITMFPLAIGVGLGRRNRLMKIGCILSAALFIAGIVATDSRGAFLALVGVGLFLTWKLGKRQRLISMIVAVFVALCFFVLIPASYSDRILSIFGMGSDAIGTASGQARTNLLKHSFYTAIRSPTGVGMGNYHIVAAHEAVSHNSYSQVASELGLIALVVYVMFLLSPFKKLASLEREAALNPDARRYYYLAIGLQASLVAYMIASFFGSIAYQWYVYYLVAYAVVVYRLYAATFGLPEADSKKNRRAKRGA